MSAEEEPADPTKRSRMMMVGVKTLFAVVVSLTVQWVDPFGFDSDSSNLAANIIWKALAPEYGGTERAGQKSIAVVTVDDASLNLSGGAWPPSFDDQIRIIDKVANFQPAAIFADVLYLGDTGKPDAFERFAQFLGYRTGLPALEKNPPDGLDCGESELTKIDCIYKANEGGKAHHIPIIIGRLSKEATESQEDAIKPKVEEITDRLDQVAMLAPVDQPAENPPGTYVLAKPTKEGEEVSPASLLFYIRCLNIEHSETACRKPYAVGGKEGGPSLFSRTVCSVEKLLSVECTHEDGQVMDIQWGWGESPEQDKVATASFGSGENAGKRCGKVGAHPFFDSARLVFDSLIKGLEPKRSEIDCRYSLVVPYQELELFGDDPSTKDLIRGKIVLLGFNFSGVEDTVDSPVLGPVEGVHVHAMALDNLIELGPDYYRYGKPPVKETPEFTTGDLAEVVIFGIFAFGAFYFGEFYGRPPSEEEEEAALAASENEEPEGPSRAWMWVTAVLAAGDMAILMWDGYRGWVGTALAILLAVMIIRIAYRLLRGTKTHHSTGVLRYAFISVFIIVLLAWLFLGLHDGDWVAPAGAIIGMAAALSLLMISLPRRMRRWTWRAMVAIGVDIVILIFIFFLMLGPAIVLKWMHLPPYNWAAVLFLTWALYVIAVGDRITERITKTLHHVVSS